MGDKLNKQNEDKEPFGFLTDMDTQPSSSSADDDDDKGKPGSGEPDEGSVNIPKKEYEDLKAKIEKLSSQPGMDEAKMKQVMENNRIVDAIKGAILPNEGEVKASELRKQEAAFDEAPIQFLKDFVQREMQPLMEQQQQMGARTFANEVMANIDKTHEVDWEKDGVKIAAQLAIMDPAYKQKNMREATLKAMQLAKVGKERKQPVSMPYFEPSNFSPEQREKARETEAEAYKKQLFGYAKKIARSPLDGFLGE